MNLAMFLFAVEHVSRICRVLSQPGGNMLLVGLGGSGRQSLARLAAFICGMEVFQVGTTCHWGFLNTDQSWHAWCPSVNARHCQSALAVRVSRDCGAVYCLQM